MRTFLSSKPADVVSAHGYARILTAPRLARMILPNGLMQSPYEVLNYDSTLTLEDPQGMRATFHRRQRIRFLQDGVAAVLDHAWGDGVLITDYQTDAGDLRGALMDEGRRHFVIDLGRRTRRGDTLDFSVTRTVMAGFLGRAEWLQTTIDHPVRRLRCRVTFPKERPCRSAVVFGSEAMRDLPLEKVRDGRGSIRVVIERPVPHRPYTVCWTW